MTYVLIFADEDKQPCIIQGSLEHINNQLRDAWTNNDIDHYDWGNIDNWRLMAVEGVQLTPVSVAECVMIPQIFVD